MNKPVYGLEITRGSQDPERVWLGTRDARDRTLEQLRRRARADADNVELKVRCIADIDSEVHYKDGPLALHCQWRMTVLRTSHATLHSYRQQHAKVDVISGMVEVVDAKEPFARQNYEEWSRNRCLEERVPGQKNAYWGDSFWPEVRPAVPVEEDCHYMVVNPLDCQRLKTESQPCQALH